MTAIIALLAIAVPALLAVQLAARQARRSATDHVTAAAASGLTRSEAAYREIMAAVSELAAAGVADPCSASNLASMRRQVVRSAYLKAVGYVKDDRLLCSSMGDVGQGFEVGPVTPGWTSPIGTRVRMDVRFPFDTERTYLMIESRNYVALVSTQLVLNVMPDSAGRTEGPDPALAVFSTFNNGFLAQQGFVDPAWTGGTVRAVPTAREVRTFIVDDHVVAVARSNIAFVGAVAALPLSQVRVQTRDTAMVLLPAVAIAGFLLALALVYWSRLQTAMPAVLRRAIKNNEFSLRYQPVVDLRTHQWVGAEALLRWRRHTGEAVPPDVFIPAAESARLIGHITQRVFELVARDLEGISVRYPQMHMAINLSTQDLAGDSRVVAALQQLAATTRMAPDRLVVEISERGLLQGDAARAVIEQIRAHDFKVAIDDFGTGYSNLAHVANFRLDYLKIDKIFVASIGRDAPTSSVVPHIVNLARTLNLEVVAEGVETEAQARFLHELGVQYAQGWLFGRPMLIDDLLRGFAQSQLSDAGRT